MRIIKITESKLRNIISESIKSLLRESNEYYSMYIELIDGFDEIFNTDNFGNLDDKVEVLYDYHSGTKDTHDTPGMPEYAEPKMAKCSPQQIQQISSVTGLGEEEINSAVLDYIYQYWDYYEKQAIEHAIYQNTPLY